MVRRSKLILLLAIVLTIGACKKAADLAKYKDQAMALVDQYGPTVKELGGKLGGLRERVKSLPTNLPVVGDLGALIDKHQGSLDKLQGLLSNLPSQVADASKGGKESEVTALLANTTGEVTKTLGDVTKGVGELETNVTSAEAAAKAAPPTPSTEEFATKLSSGFELKGAKDGVEAQLIKFLEDTTKVVDKTTWFNFDRLTFKVGGSELDLDVSNPQLANVVEILKAFPKASLKLGGYTDNTGDAAKNKQLSADRAVAVKNALVKLSVAETRLEAEGYGAEHPVCPANDTDECKAQNRRIAIRVTAK